MWCTLGSTFRRISIKETASLVGICILRLLCNTAIAQTDCTDTIHEKGYPFFHGVASGDATQHEVMLWTKISPEGNFVQLDVAWRISTDSLMLNIAGEGIAVATIEKNFCIKADAQNLEPGLWYYYEFETMGYRSPRGRTRTLPQGNEEVSFAVFSCSDFQQGYFNAYRDALQRNDFDAAIHLGDFFYEYGASSSLSDRLHEPANELFVLEDYRMRYAQYMRDSNLSELRRQYPMYMIWDDHEFRNDCYTGGAAGHNENFFGPWMARQNAAMQAWYEWMPVREMADGNMYRSFDCGTLASLVFTDTRMDARSAQVSSLSPLIGDTTRTMMSAEQMQWLVEESSNDQIWNVVFSSVMLSPHISSSGYTIDSDLWDGYVADRNRMLAMLDIHDVNNFILVSGDFHSSRAMNIPDENYSDSLMTGSAGCEFTACAVTSYPHTVGDIESFMELNPHIKFIEQTHNGYMLLHLSAEAAEAEWIYLSTVTSQDYESAFGKRAIVENLNPFLQLSDAPAEIQANELPLLAGFSQSEFLLHTEYNETQILNLFPNPSGGEFYIEFTAPAGEVEISIYSADGRIVLVKKVCVSEQGLHGTVVDLSEYPSGEYLVRIGNDVKRVVR